MFGWNLESEGDIFLAHFVLIYLYFLFALPYLFGCKSNIFAIFTNKKPKKSPRAFFFFCYARASKSKIGVKNGI